MHNNANAWQQDNLTKLLHSQSPSNQPAALSQWQSDALERFLKQTFPNRKTESWKYTSTAAIQSQQYTLAPMSPIAAPQPLIKDCCELVFNGGQLCYLSGPLPEGCTVVPLLSLADQIDWQTMLSLHDQKHGLFSDLNAAFAHHTQVIQLKAGQSIPTPILIRHRVGQSAQPVMQHPRILVMAGENSQATVIEVFESEGDTVFTNAVTQLYISDGATLHYSKHQNEHRSTHHIAHTTAHVARDAEFLATFFSQGAQLSRDTIRIDLLGPDAATDISGLYVPGEQQVMDFQLTINHMARSCRSRQQFNGVAHHNGKGVFNGTVVVPQAGAGATAHQKNSNILLSKHAKIFAKPQLEIFTDDISCSHGATIGDLDPAAVFYLTARGLPEQQARALLLEGFMTDVINHISDHAWQQYIKSALKNIFLSAAPRDK